MDASPGSLAGSTVNHVDVEWEVEGVMQQRSDEVVRLRAGLRDLAALSTMPSMWVGLDASEMIRSLLDAMVAILGLDLAFVRAEDPKGGPSIEEVRATNDEDIADRTPVISRALTPMLGASTPMSIPDPLHEGTLRIAVTPIGLENYGVLVAGSRRSEFPTEIESTLLGAAVNHAATWLRSVHLATEHARAEAARNALEAQNVYLREEIEVALAFGGIVGQSNPLRQILGQVELVAPTEATVLLLGESGTGKELFAREIHNRSRRAHRPLIKVNCSAIPRDMFETEFFGHVRGAFTGALRDRPGRFQLAEGGTLFLDEVGDLPLDLQPKLLRVLQEGQYERVGDDATREVDVRVIAATNRDLASEVKAGRFRGDLFYRLSVFPIQIPSLRERRDDIPLLVTHFVALVSKKLGIEAPPVHGAQFERLKLYDWRGNIRELQNIVERAVILSRGGTLSLESLLPALDASDPVTAPVVKVSEIVDEVVNEQEWRRRERGNLLAALKRTMGRIYGPGGAAALLGIKPSTLQSRLRALGISLDESR
jgi:transcriptional regulator with GAF, ATPase, and Fis domain